MKYGIALLVPGTRATKKKKVSPETLSLEVKVMTAHLIFGLGLIMLTLGLCYLFRKENKR